MHQHLGSRGPSWQQRVQTFTIGPCDEQNASREKLEGTAVAMNSTQYSRVQLHLLFELEIFKTSLATGILNILNYIDIDV